MFLSYRVASDAELVKKVYYQLTSHSPPISCWWGAKSLLLCTTRLHYYTTTLLHDYHPLVACVVLRCDGTSHIRKAEEGPAI